MSVMEWLLDSDPAIRWQVMRDLTNEPPDTVAAERSKVEVEGWGARLLALQDERGQWGRQVLPSEADGLSAVEVRQRLRRLQGISIDDLAGYLGIERATILAWENGTADPDDERFQRYRSAVNWMRDSIGTYNPPWVSTTFTLLLLRHMGLDPGSAAARKAVALVRDECRWDEGGQAYFDGEVEPCINGMAVALGAYFGESVDGIVQRLLGEQLADGGWNCEAERGSTRSSFHTTISVLEGLSEYERARGATETVTESRLRGQEYLLERRMMRRRSTGEIIDPAFTRLFVPSGVVSSTWAINRPWPTRAPVSICSGSRSVRGATVSSAGTGGCTKRSRHVPSAVPASTCTTPRWRFTFPTAASPSKVRGRARTSTRTPVV
jgi:transcriptional regulator with XRE-family HTH domain